MSNGFDLRVMGLVLRQGRKLNAVSWLLLVLAAAWLVLEAALSPGALSGLAVTGLWLSLAAGALQLFYAMRVDFDADLLVALADQYPGDKDLRAAADTLDGSLQSLGLINDAKAGREWPERWRGARRVLLWQALFLLLQAALLVLVGLVARNVFA